MKAQKDAALKDEPDDEYSNDEDQEEVLQDKNMKNILARLHVDDEEDDDDDDYSDDQNKMGDTIITTKTGNTTK